VRRQARGSRNNTHLPLLLPLSELDLQDIHATTLSVWDLTAA
jgi:hypothetical protein